MAPNEEIAPSLRGIKAGNDYVPNSDSWLWEDGNPVHTEDTERFGLNVAQRDTLVSRAHRALDEAEGYWGDVYDDARSAWKMFAAKDVWTEEAKALRAGRPCLNYPLVQKFVKRTIAEIRKTPPGIKLSAREDGDVRKAEIGMGLVRYIEDRSKAKYAYAHAAECAAVGGFGWVKGTFDPSKREIQLKKVLDAFSWYIDPTSEEIDGSDANWFVGKRRPEGSKASSPKTDVEFWWREEDGNGGHLVYWAYIEKGEVTDYGRFPGEIIPVFPVFGEYIKFEDELVVKGVVQDLTDAAKTFNYLKSQEVEAIALTPKSPIIAEEGTIPKEYRKDWDSCTKNPSKTLFYRAKNLDGEATQNKPEFMKLSADTAWSQQALQGSIADMKEITGVYDTALGADSRELSGKAILAKQMTADAQQFTFTEHLQATISRIGEWVIGMIKPVMGEEKCIRILGEDGKLSTVQLDQPYGDMMDPSMQTPIDLDFNQFDISVESGPAFATRREEGVNAFQSIMAAMPQSAALIADLAVKHMDVPWATEAAKRFEAMLPEQVKNADAPQGFVPASKLQEAMGISDQQMQQAATVIQQLQAKITGLQAEVDNLTQAKLTAERIKGEYGLAKERISQEGQDRRAAMQIQEDAEKATAQMQTSIIKDVRDSRIQEGRDAQTQGLEMFKAILASAAKQGSAQKPANTLEFKTGQNLSTDSSI